MTCYGFTYSTPPFTHMVVGISLRWAVGAATGWLFSLMWSNGWHPPCLVCRALSGWRFLRQIHLWACSVWECFWLWVWFKYHLRWERSEETFSCRRTKEERERETAILDMNHQCKSPVNGSLSRSFRHQWNYTHMHTHTHVYTHMDDLHVECWRDTVWHHTGSFPPTDRWMRLIS